MDISKLALAGILGASLAITGCGGAEEAPAPAPAPEVAPPPAPPAAKTAKATKGKAGKTAASTDDAKYSEIHDCAGKNSCKGLGGCKVTDAKLATLAKAAGTDMADAGEAHDCSGKNACKGLGGCGVDEEKLAKLKKDAG